MPRRRLNPESSLADAAAAWLVYLGASKPSPATLAAYRRDLRGIAGRLAGLEGLEVAAARGESSAEAGADNGAAEPDAGALGVVHLPDLNRSALRAAFASWAADHAAASVRRAHSAWSSFFDFLVAEGLLDGNPMAAIPKPKTPAALPRSIRARDAIARLLSAAAAPDPQGRHPWPARDLALVATFCVTGIREAEAVGLNVGSVQGEPGARRLEVVGKGNKARPIPIVSTLEEVLSSYQTDRRARFPDHDLGHPQTPLFVDHRGQRMRVHQVRYLVERLYVRAGIRAQVPAGALVHALRHTFATSALEVGADVVELQELLGHASLETTRRYLSATGQGLRDLVAAHPGQAALRASLVTVEDPAPAAGATA
ncbi:MAG: tyrosine-type recombinase/integrase [Acidimicrobiales bacterium]